MEAPVGMKARDLLMLGVTSSAAGATFLCFYEGGVAAVCDGGVAPVGDGRRWDIEILRTVQDVFNSNWDSGRCVQFQLEFLEATQP
uniref:Uncharacterized protein n=1 Tax=Solanum tuberosum TaxID=4113 RepID=M1DFA1_SOLTU